MGNPKFSALMCVYGKDDPQWFQAAVESIVNQTVQADEIVLVVDGPVPEALNAVIVQYESHDSFCILRLEVNQGLGNARRAGLKVCKNDLIVIMDADDLSVPDRFEKQLAMFAEHPDLDVVGGDITEFIGEPENIIGRRTVPECDDDIKQYMKTRCAMNHVTVMFKNSSLNKAGGYIDWYYNEDYYLWLRMMLAGMKFGNVPDVLVNVRVGEEMYQRRGGKKYFLSEAKLQKYMLDNKVIGLGTYLINVTKRLIVQVLLTNKLRGWVFKKFARKSV